MNKIGQNKRRLIIASCLSIVLLSCQTSTVLNGAMSDNLEGNEVVLKLDGYGTPHIYAQETFGLYYGYGYALANDRLYQLEIMKRSTQGQVSEVLGKDWVEFDKAYRQLIWPQSIRDQLRELSSEQRDVFLGIAYGINKRIAEVKSNKKELLPAEFIHNDFEPDLWDDYDVAMLFIGSMLMRYGDYNSEIENLELLADLTDQHGSEKAYKIFNDINPFDHDAAPTVVSGHEWRLERYGPDIDSNLMPVRKKLTEILPKGREFSNALVISTKNLKSDKAVLINGPQFGWYVPAYTYSAGFHMPGWDAVGNAPLGFPLPMFGYNQHITWGTTWGASDNVDIFRETLNPNNPEQYLHDGKWKDFDKRVYVVDVKGSERISGIARRSVHGPIVDYQVSSHAYAKKRGWDGNEISTIFGWIEATQATNHKEWLEAVSKSALNVNWYYADGLGNIAYFAGGFYPKRAKGHDHRLPVSGEGHKDWKGILPATSNPQVINPSSGYIANWNNKPAKGFPNPDMWWYSWSEADRIAILDQLVEGRGKLSSDGAWRLMMDASYIDPNALFFKPLMIESIRNSDNPVYHEVAANLSAWDNSFSKHDSGRYENPAIAIFREWLGEMLEATLEDDLSGEIGSIIASNTGYGTVSKPTEAGLNISVGSKLLFEVLNNRTDFDFLNGESPDALWRNSLDAALKNLTQKYGKDIDDWKLEVPPTRFKTTNFLGIPQTLPEFKNDTVPDMNRGTENNMTVFSEGSLPRGWEVVPPGQSGFIPPTGVKSKHTEDQLTLFIEHGKKSVWLSAADIDADTKSTIRLTYSRQQAAN